MAAIGLGTGIQGSSLVAGTTHTTASFAPGAAGRFILITYVHTVASGSPTDDTDPTGACISSIAQVGSIVLPNSPKRMLEVWTGVTSATASTIVFHHAASSDSCVWQIQGFTNVDRARGWLATYGGLTSNVSSGAGVTTIPQISIHKPQHTSNMLLSIWASEGSSKVDSPRLGWTQIADNATAGTPFSELETQYIIGGAEVAASVKYISSTAYAGYNIELWGIDGSGNWSAVETFTKTDGSDWGNDQDWNNVNGAMTTVGNQATSGSTVYADGIYSNDSSSSNQEGRVTASTMALSGNSVIGVKLRASSADQDCYEFIRAGATSLSTFSVLIRKRTGAANYTTLAGPLVIPRTALSTAETLRFTAIGNTLTAYLDGAQVLAVNDSSIVAPRLRGGMVLRSSVANDTRADNFTLSDVGVLTGSSVTIAVTIPTSSKATAAPGVRKSYLAKVPQSSRSFSSRLIRFIRSTGRAGTVSAAKATIVSVDNQEAFRVFRPIFAKAKTSSSLKGAVDAGGKGFVAKVGIAANGGGVFHPATLTVIKNQRVSLPASHNVTVAVKRAVGLTGTIFQSSSATAHFAGGKTSLAGKAATASGAINIPNVVHMEVLLPNVSSLLATQTSLAGGPIFYPPVEDECPTVLVRKSVGDRLFRHYRPRPVGHNVYIYSDGTVSESDPDSYSTLWRESDRTSDTLPGAVHVVRVFWGGHEAQRVTTTEAQQLADAGYSVRGFNA